MLYACPLFLRRDDQVLRLCPSPTLALTLTICELFLIAQSPPTLQMSRVLVITLNSLSSHLYDRFVADNQPYPGHQEVAAGFFSSFPSGSMWSLKSKRPIASHIYL